MADVAGDSDAEQVAGDGDFAPDLPAVRLLGGPRPVLLLAVANEAVWPWPEETAPSIVFFSF